MPNSVHWWYRRFEEKRTRGRKMHLLNSASLESFSTVRYERSRLVFCCYCQEVASFQKQNAACIWKRTEKKKKTELVINLIKSMQRHKSYFIFTGEKKQKKTFKSSEKTIEIFKISIGSKTLMNIRKHTCSASLKMVVSTLRALNLSCQLT